MASLRGDLGLIGLADLFQLIANYRWIGTLTVTDQKSRKSIYFGKEGLILLSDGKRTGPRLGEILVRTRRLTPVQVVQVTESQKRLGIRFGEAVVKLGYLKPEEVVETVREQVGEEIYDLFTWSNATFEFVEGPPPTILQDPDRPVVTLNLDVTGFILEAMRRIDELHTIIQAVGGIDSVYEIKDRSAVPEATPESDPVLWTIVQLIDGKRSIGNIFEEARISAFQGYRAFHALHQKGCMSRTAADGAGAAQRRETTRVHAPQDHCIVVMGGIAGTRRKLCEDLRKTGYTAEEAVDMAVALGILQGRSVHVLVIDAPESLEPTWAMLQQLVTLTRIPILVISPCRTREQVVRTIQSGAHDYLVRPFAPHLLTDRLQRLCEAGARRHTETTIVRRAMETLT